MRRILLLTTLAAMLAAAMALSGVAQAKPNTNGKAGVQCKKLAIQTLGSSFNTSNYNFIGGTEGNDDFTGKAAYDGLDVFCGFGGNDSIYSLDEGDIFLGGAGNDSVTTNTVSGTFYGDAGDDSVYQNVGTFNGGDGNDSVYDNPVSGTLNGTFNGGAGDDSVTNINGGIFNGGDGNDSVFWNFGYFYGEAGNDSVTTNNGIYDGGEGLGDYLGYNAEGAIVMNVP